ncbi:hypothetical protein ACFTRD_32230 [Paenibacillus sp. NPDC056933]|uniref:AAA family ATPase n=1 Tax=Paenibacillus sp. NPDC056933 TaxID=3345968 RepID=UPI00363C7737
MLESVELWVRCADPNVGNITFSAIESAERLGLPEAGISLSVPTCVFGLTPKSNTAYTALDRAWGASARGSPAMCLIILKMPITFP